MLQFLEVRQEARTAQKKRKKKRNGLPGSEEKFCHFSRAVGTERIFFLYATSRERMYWLGPGPRYFAMSAASKPREKGSF